VLTAVTAILGVLPIAFGVNIEFLTRDVHVGAPATQWWIQLSTAIVFGLGFATVLTLIVTPAALMAIANLSEKRKLWAARLRRRKPAVGGA
jgi:multidrug efflux pump